MIKTKETEVATIQLIEGQIVKITFKNRVDLTPEHTLMLRQIALDWTQGRGYCTFIVPGEFVTYSSEIKDVMAKHEHSKDRIAVAVYQSNLAIKLIVDLFWNITKKKDPTRMFRNENDALQWLRKCRDQHNTSNQHQKLRS
ncbi:MAG: hypothetical protein KDC84_14620 [Crocinitomicaceae bacterium]|nr:hypothetical protein [Crocinitomicaceae bacterium]